MRVRVTSPYNSEASAVNLEQIGKLRAFTGEPTDTAWQCAASWSTASETPSAGSSATPQGTTRESAMTNSRERAALRGPIAVYRTVEIGRCGRVSCSGAHIGLSPQGCYVDTLNHCRGDGGATADSPLRFDSDVLANVSSRHIGSGMGLEFGEITAAQKAVLENWLANWACARACSIIHSTA